MKEVGTKVLLAILCVFALALSIIGLVNWLSYNLASILLMGMLIAPAVWASRYRSALNQQSCPGCGQQHALIKPDGKLDKIYPYLRGALAVLGLVYLLAKVQHSTWVQLIEYPHGSSHTTSRESNSQRCEALTARGSRCKRNAEIGSVYCWQHQRR